MDEIDKIFYFREINNHQEILMVLLLHFDNAKMIGNRGYRFQKKEQSSFLDVYINENGKIIEISLSKEFPKSILDEIEEKIIESLLENQKTNFGQTVGFSYKPVEGYYKYKDIFQLIPLPDYAPKPKVAFADHPFLLQFKYDGSINNFIDVRRKQEKSDIIIRLLNIFLDTRIHSLSHFAEFTWNYISQVPNNLSSEWRQVGYSYKGLSGKIDEYSKVDSFPTIELEQNKKYYSERYPMRYESIKLPDNIDNSFDIVFELNTEDWTKLKLACYWYYLASDVLLKSNSLSYVSLISALESLIDKPSKEDYCESCHQPILRLSKRFRQFLKKYVPTLDNYSIEKKLLYEIRSKLLHGSSLFVMDYDPSSLSFLNTEAWEQREIHENLQFIAKIAILNWLWGKA